MAASSRHCLYLSKDRCLHVMTRKRLDVRCTCSDSLPLCSLSSRAKRDQSFSTSLDVKGVSLTKRQSSSLGS